MDHALLPAPASPSSAVAVLSSGGLDSAVLLAMSLESASAVFPLYVRQGLYWENAEQQHLRRFLDAVRTPALMPLQVLELPLADLLDGHWSITGHNAPSAGDPDETVFLPGRNVLLLAKAMLWCHLHKVPALALGLLAGNPFPDATPGFLAQCQDLLNKAVRGTVRLEMPLAALSKAHVLRRAGALPLGLTFSCLQPQGGLHCGRCNKCGERSRAFSAAGLADPTFYSAPPTLCR